MNEKANWDHTVNDNHQFIIALIIICSFVIIMGLAVLTGVFSEAENVIMTFSAFVGTIMGFYFGQRPLHRLTQEVAKVNQEKSKIKSDAENTIDETSILQNDVRHLKNDVESLKSLVGDK